MQDRKPPQIKDLKLMIPKDYTFLADSTIFIVLARHTRQISWKDCANQVNFTPWLIQNIPWYSSKIIVNAL